MDVQNNDYAQYRCRRCQIRAIDTTENPASCLCAECRNDLIKLRIPIPVWLISGVVLVAMIAAFVLAIPNMQDYGKYRRAPKQAKEGYILTALNDMVDIADKYPFDEKAAIRLADIGMQYGYYDYAAYAIDNYLVGKEVNDTDYAKLNRYIDKLDLYYATYDTAQQLAAAMNSTEDLQTYSEGMQNYYEGLKKCLGEQEYDQALVNYYLSYVTADMQEREGYLKECIQEDATYFDAYAQLANLYRREGKLELANELADRAYKINKEDYSVLRSKAILALLANELEQGLTYARNAYEIYAEGDYVIDTYIVALASNNRLEEAKQIKEEYAEEGYYFDDDMESFLAGNMTLQEYYIDEEEE